MNVDKNTMISAAMEYASYGWRVLPIKPRSKLPIAGKDWHKKATTDEDQIIAWWEKYPEANLGVQLGECSGIIDFEGDGAEAEETLAKIFGENPPPTPTYTSSRGKHRIFKFRGDLPGQGKNHFKIGNLEIRTGYGGMAAQSVFPPSVHADGTAYRWTISPSECDPAEISDAVMAWLWNWFGEPTSALPTNKRAAKDWRSVAEGVGEGKRNDTLASYTGRLLSDLLDPFNNAAIGRAFEYVKAWNERNKPPLDAKELRTTFDSILARERQKRTSLGANEHFDRERAPEAPDEWRLEIITAEPREYRLYSPLWATKIGGGGIRLTADDLLSPRRIRRAALEQADVWIDRKKFDPRWEGTKGVESLARQLIVAAELIAATPEKRRSVVVAEAVLSSLNKARPAGEIQGPDPRGRPIRMADGDVWFQVAAIHEDLGYTLAKITHGEIVDALEKIGATSRQKKMSDGVRRYKVVTRNALRSLQAIAEVDDQIGSAATL